MAIFPLSLRSLVLAFFASAILFSCVSFPDMDTAEWPDAISESEYSEEEPPDALGDLAEAIEERPAEDMLPEVPTYQFDIPEQILGSGQISASLLASFLLQVNPLCDSDFAEELSRFYEEEAALEGVNHDIAFAQMCLETGFLRFGGLVTLDMNNFCGLGAISDSQRGEYFASPQIGVRAHIQHLKGYATEEPLALDLVDPRYRWVRLGSSPTFYGLSGTWAADLLYGEKLYNILQRLYLYSTESLVLGEPEL